TYVAGNSGTEDRITLTVTVKQVDPTNDDIVFSVLATPEGSLVADDGTPTKTFVTNVGTANPPRLRFPAKKPIAVQTGARKPERQRSRHRLSVRQLFRGAGVLRPVSW